MKLIQSKYNSFDYQERVRPLPDTVSRSLKPDLSKDFFNIVSLKSKE